MSIRYYEELRRVHKEISILDETIDVKEKEQKKNQLLAAVRRIRDLANLARREGLLALDEAVENMEGSGCDGFLKHLIDLVVDGTAPEDIRSIGLSRYFCSMAGDYDAVNYLIYLEGALAIQAGDNPRIVDEKERALLPNDLYEKYTKMLEEEQKVACEEDAKSIIERLCTGKRLWNPSDNGYYVMKLADYALCDIDDRGLQRILREIDNIQLVVAMKGLSGDARRHIFDNLSERLAKMLAEDMEHMGPVRALSVLEATQKILTIMIRLIDEGEIIDKYEYLKPFYDMFSVDSKNAREKDMRFDKLKLLVKEYEEAAGKSIS